VGTEIPGDVARRRFCKHDNARVPHNAPNALTGCMTTSFSGRILLHDGANKVGTCMTSETAEKSKHD
jgi:hypothetical protein